MTFSLYLTKTKSYYIIELIWRFREVQIISLDKNFKLHINIYFTYAIKNHPLFHNGSTGC